MGRLIFWLLLGVVAWAVLRAWARGAPPPRAERPAEDMVRCAHCGLNLPRSSALAAGSDWYCGEPHRRAAAGAARGP